MHTETEAYRAGHVVGNRMLTGVLTQLFGQRFTDILSGYRAFFAPIRKVVPCARGRIRDRDRANYPCFDTGPTDR